MGLEDWGLCHGCLMHDPPYSCKDGADPVFNDKQCPCVICLVKVTCNSPCRVLTTYLFDIGKMKSELWKKLQ